VKEVINISALDYVFPEGLMISDPPYNQGYHYSSYKDNVSDYEYKRLLSVFRKPCVVIGYPEMIINDLTPILGWVDEVVCWVYNSNTAKQSRLIAWYGCKPNFRKVGQPYKNPTDKRIKKRISEGKVARSYDWWEINQVKNVSKKNNAHPCPIPEELARRIILMTAQEGQTIIDPFAGSGTVLKSASDLGFDYIGTELDKTYCEIIKNHLTTTEGLGR
jgi:DNA modification methylase